RSRRRARRRAGRQAGAASDDAGGRLLHRGSRAMKQGWIALLPAIIFAGRSPERLALHVSERAGRSAERLALQIAERGDIEGGARAFQASVTYSKDVAPLLADRCGMCHHAGGSAPFSLLTYADAKQHATQIAAVTARRF